VIVLVQSFKEFDSVLGIASGDMKFNAIDPLSLLVECRDVFKYSVG
jgi:hypothetical protein